MAVSGVQPSIARCTLQADTTVRKHQRSNNARKASHLCKVAAAAAAAAPHCSWHSLNKSMSCTYIHTHIHTTLSSNVYMYALLLFRYSFVTASQWHTEKETIHLKLLPTTNPSTN